MDEIPSAIPFYKSKVLRGIAIATVSQILSRFHITAQFAPQAAPIVDTALDLLSLYFAYSAAYARVKHPLPAITSTQAKADAANLSTTAAPAAPLDKPPEKTP